MANKDTKLSGVRDKEGFILLKPTADFKFNNKKPKTVKKSSNPYKKGTKKYRMYKSCKIIEYLNGYLIFIMRKLKMLF